MTSLATGVFFFVCAVLTGWGPTRRFAPRDLGGLGRFAWSTAIGAALTGQVQVLLGACGVAAGQEVPIVLAVASTLWAWRQGRVETRVDGPLPSWVVAAFAVVVVVSSGVALGLPFTSDGSKFWAPRAREMVEFGAIDMPTLHEEELVGFHRRYPLLVPAVMAPAFAGSPRDATSGPKVMLHLFTVALLAFATDRLGRRGPRGRALLVALLAMPTWTQLKIRESAVAAGYVDAVVALWLVLIVDEILRDGASRRSLAVMAFAAGAAWATKYEGIVTVIVLLLAWLLASPARWRSALTVVVGAALLAVPTVVIQQTSLPDASIVDLGLLTDVDMLFGRSVPVLVGFGARVLDVTAFGFLPLLLVVWLPAAWRDERADAATRRLSIWLVLGVFGWFTTIYLLTTMNVGRHVNWLSYLLLI